MSDGATDMLLETQLAMSELAEDFATADHELVWQVRDTPIEPETAMQNQVGGSHYKNYFIQPVEFIHMNGLGFLEGCVIKRVCRHRDKNGKEDLEKAIHELQLLIEMEYPA